MQGRCREDTGEIHGGLAIADFPPEQAAELALHLPTSPCISLYLPISPCISLHLVHISLQGLQRGALHRVAEQLAVDHAAHLGLPRLLSPRGLVMLEHAPGRCTEMQGDVRRYREIA